MCVCVVFSGQFVGDPFGRFVWRVPGRSDLRKPYAVFVSC